MENTARKEIESHSSALTNMRINELFNLANSAEMNANSMIAPTIQDAIGYHAILLTLYFETNSVYDVNEELKEQVEELVKKGEQISNYLKQNKTVKQQYVELLINNCKKLRYSMQVGLQNMRYFFRFGQHDPKGISASLEIFKIGEEKEFEKEVNKKQ